MGELETNIQYLGGVGPKRAELLRRELGIETLSDLIHLYPFRYVDRSGITPIAEARPDLASLQIRARVVSRTLYGPSGSIVSQDTNPIHFNACKRMSVMVEDGSGTMEIVFFKGIRWNYGRLVPGSSFIFFGKPQEFNGRINMVHPEVDVPAEGHVSQSALTGVYPSSEKLKLGGITGKVMNRLEASALSLCLPEIRETLPAYILERKRLMPRNTALWNIHFPKNQEALQRASYRLKYEELFLLQLALLKQKYIRSRASHGLVMPKVGPDFHSCYNALPYSLTGAQQRVIKEIRADLTSGMQMNRLLQGDVGSGKTMVAVLSCLIAAGNGYQSCIMAPTEVLAQQHFANIRKYLAPTSVRAALLTGSTGQKERREIHAGLEDGSIGIIVGTHALIEDDVVFRNLGLAVIDEQHRFGVDQRARLWAKNSTPPHILVMTATPIPRTLAMTLYGDLDVSVIDEMPPGRKPVKTVCIGQNRKPAMFRFLREEIAKGRQVFIVYPLIYESDKLDLRNLQNGYDEIMRAFPLPDYKVAIVHGQQGNEEKQFNMEAFAAGRADILVSTTVIEVGVDVPNASVMVIESAQRFGLSQLHQLRGRVGRGAEESYCILVKDVKTSREAQQRLDLMCATEDGFEIAEQDMRMRGPGDLEGTQQSGLPVSLKLASLARDGGLLSEARRDAQGVLDDDPSLSSPANRPLAEELKKGKYEIKNYSTIS
ncbi:MAG TPA: ATP-dependent DNA helicase RecG [Candidatus Cryptobacteroides excrementigallinarum]|nr:ATP-dependent DNA helicase RecG [Candidatus Cryptobacteroides excrementigallinarum]